MDTKKNASGRFVFSMTEDEYHIMDEDSGGFCLACGADACGVEPDARKYECEVCGEAKVYGLQELLMAGRVKITV